MTTEKIRLILSNVHSDAVGVVVSVVVDAAFIYLGIWSAKAPFLSCTWVVRFLSSSAICIHKLNLNALWVAEENRIFELIVPC